MTGLRQAAERLRRQGAYPILSLDRLFAVQRASAALEGRRLDGGRRSTPGRTLRRRLATIAAETPGLATLVATALAEERRSVDRALILAYLRSLPSRHPDFEALRAAAEQAANRHAWRWRERGERLSLWAPSRDADGAWTLPEEARAACDDRSPIG